MANVVVNAFEISEFELQSHYNITSRANTLGKGYWNPLYRLSPRWVKFYHSRSSTRMVSFTDTSARAGCNTKSTFQQSFAGFNAEFSFSSIGWHTKVKESSLLNYLPIACGRIVGFIPFLKVLTLFQKQTASARIWTRFPVSISNDDNHHTPP